jgi:hypothetical protein
MPTAVGPAMATQDQDPFTVPDHASATLQSRTALRFSNDRSSPDTTRGVGRSLWAVR